MKLQTKQEGFTLIEMMVVIAVIGILSAAVLAGLGPSRQKAKDARIMSGVQQARAIAETHYDPVAGGYPATLTGDAGFDKVNADVTKLNSTGLKYKGDGAGNFAIVAALASDSTKAYCVDATGTAGEVAGSGERDNCGAVGTPSGCTGTTTSACGTGFTGNQVCANGAWNRAGCVAVAAAGSCDVALKAGAESDCGSGVHCDTSGTPARWACD